MTSLKYGASVRVCVSLIVCLIDVVVTTIYVHRDENWPPPIFVIFVMRIL